MMERDTSSCKLSYDLHHVLYDMSIYTHVNECDKIIDEVVTDKERNAAKCTEECQVSGTVRS